MRVEECLTEKDAMSTKKRKGISEYGGSERKGRDFSFIGSRFQGSRNFKRGVSQQSTSRSITTSVGRSERGSFSQGRAESKKSEGSVSVSQGYRLDVVGFTVESVGGPRQILYFYCGKPRHIARDCWSKNRANESQVTG